MLPQLAPRRARICRMTDHSPDDFWTYAAELYARPGVEAACLAAQDRAGADVMLLLFGVWSGAAGLGALSAVEASAARALAQHWSGEVVRPLREIRRRLKDAALPGAPGLRGHVRDVELAAERILAAALEGQVRRPPVFVPSRADAAANIAALLPPLAPDVVQPVLDAAFPQKRTV